MTEPVEVGGLRTARAYFHRFENALVALILGAMVLLTVVEVVSRSFKFLQGKVPSTIQLV